jgi:hypothetical protein
MADMPRHDDVIVFSVVPCASYCSTGVAYRVDRPHDRGDFRFVNVERGSATIDRPWQVALATWSKVEG